MVYGPRCEVIIGGLLMWESWVVLSIVGVSRYNEEMLLFVVD